jgi:NAD(P)-dependent dehydrogenase (short-subunit alcohol dehydrogenase family)
MANTESPAGRIFSVRGERALVTGAASGLGFAISEVLAESGATVTMVDVDKGALEAAREALAGRGADVRAHVANVENATEIRAAVDGVVGEFGRIDIVFANAGIHRGVSFRSEDGFLESFPHDAWRAVIDLDLCGAFFTLQAAAVHMKAQGSGRIIVTASTAGMRSDPYTGYAYVAAKAGLINASRQAAFELAPFGVQVNVIAPGPFKTNIGGEEGRSAETEARWAATIPLGRMAEPSEIQGLALLLASNASSFMTGAVIAIDGGALTKQHPVEDQVPRSSP